MKSLTVWRRHSTRPSLSAGTARKVSGHLSGRRPLHLANARPFGRSKAPLGLLLLRKRELAYGRQSRLIMQTTKNRAFPVGERPVVHIAIACGFLQGASAGRTLFFFTMLHHFLRAASGIRHQHGSESDAAHPGIVPIFCAGMPCKLAKKQCHFPAYCPILSA